MPVESLRETSTSIEKEKSTFETPIGTPSGARLGDSYVIIKAEGLERMEKEIEILKKKLLEREKTTEFREVSDIEAKKEITDFIFRMKEKGISKISILDIINNLNLPPEQIEKLVEEFEKTGRVSEINE